MQPLDLLAIAAHPDDVELACAGTMLMAKRAGKRTGIVDLTRGELSTRGTLESRANETKAATEILQLDYRANLDMSDGNIELSQANLHKLIVEFRKTRPTVLLTPHRAERHPDHEAASELAHRAVFYGGLTKIETKDEDGNIQAPHRPLLVLHYMQTLTFEPRIIVDISSVMDLRMKAVEAYGSQFARLKNSAESESAHKASPETFLSQSSFYDWLRARAGSYGMLIGADYGEPFWSHEPLGVKDIFHVVTKKVA